MAGSHEQWLERGNDLEFFLNNDEQIKYILAWKRDDIVEVLELLIEGFKQKSYNLELINYMSFPEEYEIATYSLDCPKTIANLRKRHFKLITYGGTVTPPKYFIDDDGTLNEDFKVIMLAELVNLFMLTDNTQKKNFVNKLIDETFKILTTSSNLCDLVRGIIVSLFVNELIERNNFLIDNPKVEIVKNSTFILSNRLKFAGLSWIEVYGESSKLVTFEKLKEVNSIIDLDDLLSTLENSNTQNLITYLRCTPD